MFGWSIRASACRSASKRAMTCAGVHAGLDQLDGDQALDRLGLLGHPDAAHAALADLLDELVRADHRAGALGDRLVIFSRFRARRNILEKAARGVVGVQERFDFTAQARRRSRRPGRGTRPGDRGAA